MADENPVQETVKRFILEQLLPGEDPSLLTSTTPLMSTGILDSLAMLKLTLFLEGEFNIEVKPHEANEEHFNTLEMICSYVESKR